MPKPANLPEWSTDTNYSNGPDLGTPTKVAPSAPFQAEGWVPGNKLASQILNWWKNLVYDWVVWFDSLKLEQGYRYKGTVVFTSSGTYNRPADVKAVRVTVVGGGGGGGYAAPCAAGQLSCGSGGGGGATAVKLVDIAGGLGASETVTVGSGGAGGDASGPASAANGGQSSFGAHVSANGGSSGFDDTAPVASGTFSGLSGGTGSSTTSGADVTIRGQTGGIGVITTAGTHTHTNRGGDSAYGRGGTAPASRLAVGGPGLTYGGGGGGGNCEDSGAGADGGDGAAGVVIIEEFY